MPHLTTTDLPSTLTRQAITPEDSRYERVRHTYVTAGAPAVVIVADDADDVGEATQVAAERGLALSLRSGGHGPSTNDGGMVIDLGRLRRVEVLDPARRIVRAEAGARWGEVARVLDGHDLALTSGDYGDVGVGGLATVGGVGLLARSQGLTIDQIMAVDVVLADGTLVRANGRRHADLFWAVRGAGGAMGTVTAFELQAGTIGNVTSATFTYGAHDLAGLLARWADLVEASPREVTSFLYVRPGVGGPLVEASVVFAGGDVAAGREAVAPFAEIGPVVDQRVALVRYAQLIESSRAQHAAQAAGLSGRGGLLDHVTHEGAAAIADLVTSGSAVILQLRSVGGAVNDVAPDATAYAHRQQNFSLVAVTAQPRRPQLDSAWLAGIAPHVRGTYLNFEIDRDETVLRKAYPGRTLARLQALKRRYDPTGVFHHSLPLPA